MKKSMKKLVMIIGLALIICSVAVVIAGATTETVSNPEIISKNIYYDEKYEMMFAVDASTASEDVELEFYDANNTLVGTYKPTTYTYYDEEKVQQSSPTWPIKPAGSSTAVEAYVFVTEGIAPKDIVDYYYVTAVDGNKSSEEVRYSVAEYMNERLYGGSSITDNQKELYQNVLKLGASAQKVLVNDRLEEGETAEALVTDYKYVSIEGGTIKEGTEGVEYKCGMYLPTTELTITPDSGNEEATYLRNRGYGYPISKVTGNTFTVSEEGRYCNIFPDDGSIAIFEDENTDISGLLENVVAVGLEYKVVEDQTDSSNHVLEVVKADGSSKNNTYVYIKPKEAGNCYVFEARMYYTNVKNAVPMQIFIRGGASGTAASAINVFNLYYNTEVEKFCIQQANASGTGYILDANGNTSFTGGLGEWITWRFEFYFGGTKDTTITKFYAARGDGEMKFMGEAVTYKTEGALEYDYVNSVRLCHQAANGSTLNLDDVSFTRIDKAYVAGE